MPTRNRRHFVSQSIWYFLRQDYAPRELIILDDGEDAIADLIPNDERIRYQRLDRHISLGAKRNLACEMSRGEYIAHWDDDDWISPQRLSIQVAELRSSGAAVCGARDLLHYRIDAGEAWHYQCPTDARLTLAGCTLLYRREVCASHRFPEINVGEDSAFAWQFPPEQLHALKDSSFYVALIHPGNTAAKNLTDARWQRRPLDEVSHLIYSDRDFYVRLRNGRTPTDSVPRPSVSSVTVGAPFMTYDGYGSMAEYLVLGMARAGAKVHVVPFLLDLNGLTGELQQLLRDSRSEQNSPVLYFCWPREELKQFESASDLFINTMWESSRLPANWTPQLNRSRAVIVPSQFVADVCRASGVTVPLVVVPEGIDPEVYHYQARPERASMTTLIVGTIIDRKHTRAGIAAWKRAFGDDPEARLIIKSRFDYGNFSSDDPRIRFIAGSEATRGIPHWYREADVLLALGNEGFGLPLVEGMATGLPVIALNSEGQSDTIRAAKDCVLAVAPERWGAYDPPMFGRAGVVGVPGVESVAEKLRWVAKHRDEARAIGRAASEWATNNRSVWRKGPSVLDVMEQFSQPTRPLRMLNTFWVPSWGTPCGIAQFTAHLLEFMPNVRVSNQPPDWRGVRVLHVQHEGALFDEVQLTREVQQARQARVPVVITEHSVKGEINAWEREANALVALTPHGADCLRARWQTKRVEYIPHGCPTWFPPRKRARGRVIGTFGFLESHKGYWQLLEVLRAIPGTELLIFSHAKSAESATRWANAIEGMAVRWIREFLPAEEIARRLAAEADILAFWYDQVPIASASGAVRTGLATGVPVLTSNVSWFQDLRGITFQPDDLIKGVEQLLDDTALREDMSDKAREYCHAHSWQRIAQRHLALWQQLEST